MKDLKQFIKTKLRDFLNENVIYNSQYNVYHGTDFEFDEFKTRRKVSGYGYSMGVYFSSSEKEAKRYGKNIKQIYHTFL
jgi:hypothetical protein